MGRLLETQLPGAKLAGLLWEQVADGTVVWREPTAAEKRYRRERRETLMRESRIPWIVSDIGSLAQFYDDAQDVVAFTRWNRRLFSKREIQACLRSRAAEGRRGAARLFGCLCPLPRGTRKRLFGQHTSKTLPKGWALIPALARMFPGLAPVWWVLLAGQVSYSLFGVGLKLGGIMGSFMELVFRGFEEFGLPFGPEHNKYHQLKHARVLQNAYKGCGAFPAVDWEDRLTAFFGLHFSIRDTPLIPQIVVQPEDYPSWDKFFDDPFNTTGSLVGLVGSLLPNAASYMVHDFVEPMLGKLGSLITGVPISPPIDAPDYVKAGHFLLDRGVCTQRTACMSAIEDILSLWEWGQAKSLTRDRFEKFRLIADELIGPTVLTPEGERVPGTL